PHRRRARRNAGLRHGPGLRRPGRAGQWLSHPARACIRFHALARLNPSMQQETTMITTPSGLQYEDTVTGQGEEARAGRPVQVHYTGWLYQDGVAGRKFDSSKDRGQPFEFPLGMGHVIRGWDEGVQGMKVGGTRRLVIPPE